MADIEKTIKGLSALYESMHKNQCYACSKEFIETAEEFGTEILADAIELLKEQEKEIKALRLLVEWAEECDFGFDQFPDEYERYKNEIKDMKYIEGMIHVAKRTLEDHGAFEEGR